VLNPDKTKHHTKYKKLSQAHSTHQHYRLHFLNTGRSFNEDNPNIKSTSSKLKLSIALSATTLLASAYIFGSHSNQMWQPKQVDIRQPNGYRTKKLN
jgi:hypothetical protein